MPILAQVKIYDDILCSPVDFHTLCFFIHDIWIAPQPDFMLTLSTEAVIRQGSLNSVEAGGRIHNIITNKRTNF